VTDGASRIADSANTDRTRGLRGALRTAALVSLAALTLTVASGGSAVASEHITVTGEYGKEGPKSSGIGTGCRLAYRAPNLYLFSDSQIYGLSVTPGAATPLAGNFPIAAGISSSCWDPDMEVSQVTGNLFAAPSSHAIHGWAAGGLPLGSPWPVDAGGETCGVAVTASGEIWGGNYGNSVVSKFTSAGVANGTIPLGFNACKIAVDPATDDLYAVKYGGGEIVKFTAASGYTTSSAFAETGSNNAGVAINGAEGKVYVGNNSTEVKVYDTTTAAVVETITLPEAGGMGIAVDEGTDTLFVTVGSGESGYIQEYLGVETPKATTGEPTGNSEVSGTADPNGQGDITECYFEYGLSPSYGETEPCIETLPITSTQTVHADLPGLLGEETYHYRLVVGNGEPYKIGRGSDKTIIPHNVKGLKTEPADEITQESALLHGSFEGTNEDTHYYFEYGRTTNYGNTTAEPPYDDAGTTNDLTPLTTPVTGLRPGSEYHFRVVAENSIGVSKGLDKTFTTFEPPTITSFTASHLTASSADIEANINPNGFETEYEVEYGTTTDYGESAPASPGLLEAGGAPEPVTIPLSGLEPTVYHFRVVARNVWGTTVTSDRTFTFFPPSCPNSQLRQLTGASYLPDCRAYEIVSPELAGNILLRAISQPTLYPEHPSRFLFYGLAGVLSGTGGTNAYQADTYVSTRTNDGWVSKYTGIHSDTGVFNFFAMGNRSLDRFLNTTNSCCGELLPRLFDTNEDFLGRWPLNYSSVPGAEQAVGAFQPSPDFDHMAFSSQTDFDPEGNGVTSAPGSAYDYDVAANATELISKTASGDDITQDPANPDAAEVIEFPGRSENGPRTPKAMYPSVSIDGSHILMSTKGCASCTLEHLYMRVGGGSGFTWDIAPGTAVDYYGMTADGLKVFFTTNQKLTLDDTDTSVDLYEWSEEGALAAEPLTRISAASSGEKGDTDDCSSEWASKCDVVQVEGQNVTDNPISTESGDVYFYSPELLDDGENGAEGGLNLYAYRGGAIRLVTTLSANGTKKVSRLQVSPDGAHAAFMTTAKLTAYNNVGLKEMYSFDPATEAVDCVSCIPSGVPPTVAVEGSVSGPFMSDDGRTFFGTTDTLVDQDTNEGSDVYEYVDGRPQLISTGRGQVFRRPNGRPVPISLMGVSPSGLDVYFATYDTLVPQDRNGAFLKFYDARVGGGFAFERQAPPCEAADECHEEGSALPAPAVITSDGSLGAGDNARKPSKKKKAHKKKHKGKGKKSKGKRKAHRRGNHG